MSLFTPSFNLKRQNSFGISAETALYANVFSDDDLVEALAEVEHLKMPLLVLGGGSNMLFTKNWSGATIHPAKSDFAIINETENHVFIQVDAGMVWHNLVLKTVELGFGGLENLSLIPGNVGASPIQNIGAYGVELKDVVHRVRGYNLDEKLFVTLTPSDCAFGYRDSIFKREFKAKFIITEVVFKLDKNPVLNLEYGSIKTEVETAGIHNPTVKDISEIVSRIRTSKLPDPSVIGNGGSFFKNPEVATEIYEALKSEFSAIPGFKVANDKIKLSAAWLIEQCGWKGYRKGDAGTYEKHALVLVNHGNAKGSEIWSLAMEIKESVFAKFNVVIEPEVNII